MKFPEKGHSPLDRDKEEFPYGNLEEMEIVHRSIGIRDLDFMFDAGHLPSPADGDMIARMRKEEEK